MQMGKQTTIPVFQPHIGVDTLMHLTDALDVGWLGRGLRVIEEAMHGFGTRVGSDRSDVFHFGTGRLHTTADLLQIIARVSGRPVHHEEIPVDGDLCNVAMSSGKAHSLLGWSPHMSIEKGLALTV